MQEILRHVQTPPDVLHVMPLLDRALCALDDLVETDDLHRVQVVHQRTAFVPRLSRMKPSTLKSGLTRLVLGNSSAWNSSPPPPAPDRDQPTTAPTGVWGKPRAPRTSLRK